MSDNSLIFWKRHVTSLNRSSYCSSGFDVAFSGSRLDCLFPVPVKYNVYSLIHNQPSTQCWCTYKPKIYALLGLPRASTSACPSTTRQDEVSWNPIYSGRLIPSVTSARTDLLPVRNVSSNSVNDKETGRSHVLIQVCYFSTPWLGLDQPCWRLERIALQQHSCPVLSS